MYEVSCTVWVSPLGSVQVTVMLACLQGALCGQAVRVQVRVKLALGPLAVSLPLAKAAHNQIGD